MPLTANPIAVTSSAAPPTRWLHLDWLRIIAFALLVPYHVGMVFVSWPYHFKHMPAVMALEPWLRLTSPWRMDLLFVVSGAATAFMLRRAGAPASHCCASGCAGCCGPWPWASGWWCRRNRGWRCGNALAMAAVTANSWACT